MNEPQRTETTDSTTVAELPAAALREQLQQERHERRLALVAQEHRLIPAVINLVNALLNRDRAERSAVTPSAVSAVLWCLVPSAATASISLLAVASTLVAWRQAQLLSDQNEKIQIQNVLAEAQRRSGLVVESTAIFDLLERERRSATPSGKKTLCDEQRLFECWKNWPNASHFVPSQATVGRIASLTKALRPYRYLNVETESMMALDKLNAGRLQKCFENSSMPVLNEAVRFLADRPLLTELQSGADTQKAIVDLQNHVKGIRSNEEHALQSILSLVSAPFKSAFSSLNDAPNSEEAHISCSPTSPERGQLLVSLVAAEIDLAALSDGGADFRFADVSNANFQRRYIHGVDLSYSRLPNANFTGATIERVSFENAYIPNARWAASLLEKVNLGYAVIASGSSYSTQATLYFAKLNQVNLEGVRVISHETPEELFRKWCAGRLLADTAILAKQTDGSANANNALPDNFDNFAFVATGTSNALGAKGTQGVLAQRTLPNASQLVGDAASAETAGTWYWPLRDCGQTR